MASGQGLGDKLRTALAQINATVGDIDANVGTMRCFIGQAKDAGCEMVVFPEMCVCGYPPEDLLLKKHFLDANRIAIDELAGACQGITVVAGFAESNTEGPYNSLAVMRDGEVRGIYRKVMLPNYGVFDEKRYFQSGGEPLLLEIGGGRVMFTICEDIWRADLLYRLPGTGQPRDMIVNISASPFNFGKIKVRREILSRCATHFGCPVAYCNLVGGQDELVFDGRSMVVDGQGAVVCRAKAFAEDLLVFDIEPSSGGSARIVPVSEGEADPNSFDIIDEVYNALVLGTRDYVRKNGFVKVLIGLSGGVDSSLTAAIAVDALGAENVIGITMPTRFNSDETRDDARRTAENLSMEFHSIPIEGVLRVFHETLGAVEGWDDKTVAYENLQARIRGTILMSLSNRFSYMVLTTGNKSETAVGYSTLYGDTAGGFAVIKDVPKTMVYELSRHVNAMGGREIIPESVITRAPSAELRPDQKDSDSLPEYDVLDRILKGYIEEDKSVRQLTEMGLDEQTVVRVTSLVDRNEYKRRQSPPGVRITPKAFGKDRRMPITNYFRAK
jgi:NAD+ synthase (glutamine-hydrolysing)